MRLGRMYNGSIPSLLVSSGKRSCGVKALAETSGSRLVLPTLSSVSSLQSEVQLLDVAGITAIAIAQAKRHSTNLNATLGSQVKSLEAFSASTQERMVAVTDVLSTTGHAPIAKPKSIACSPHDPEIVALRDAVAHLTTELNRVKLTSRSSAFATAPLVQPGRGTSSVLVSRLDKLQVDVAWL